MMVAAIPKEKQEEIMRRFNLGEKKSAISKSMRVCMEAVLRYTPRVAGPRAKVTPEMIAEMIRLAESGKSEAEVALAVGVAKTTAYSYTRYHRPIPPPTPQKKLDAVTRRALAGESISSIARESGISRFIIIRALRPALKNIQLSDETKEAILAARQKGVTTLRIATDFSIPLAMVRTVLGINVLHRYYDNEREKVIDAVASGEPIGSAADRIGVNRQTAWDWVQAAATRGLLRLPQKPLQKGDDPEFTWITRADPRLGEWQKLIVDWIKSDQPGQSNAVTAISKFIGYLIDEKLPQKPTELLQRGRSLPDFYETSCPKSASGRRSNTAIFDLIEWVLDSPGFVEFHDGEAVRTTELYRNPINRNAGFADANDRRAESSKIVMPYFLIADLRKRIVQGPYFKDWTWVQQLGEHNKAGDWFTVTEHRIDRADPDCVWRIRKRENKPDVLEMWSPARWVHALLHLQTTIRSGQARMVDSGEADTFVWMNGRFSANDGPLKRGTRRMPHRQGVFRQPPADEVDQGTKIVLYFNTNKTGDRGKLGVSRGFDCPWPISENLDEDPYYWLAKLRDWQVKFNPITKLTSWRDLKGATKLSTITLGQASHYPDAAFLFRAAEDLEHRDWPISSAICYFAWQKLLAAYERVLANEDIKHASGKPIELINPDSGLAWSSPHATRTSLITHLVLDGNIPPAIMMKVAGHSRLVMTIYYTKAGQQNIRNAIKDATAKIEASKYHTFERDLLDATADKMREKVIFNAQDWKQVLSENPADRNPLGWMHMHDGICLAGGNSGSSPTTAGCHNGSLISSPKGNGRRDHGPVPGGVRNCCRCRWKAAGKQHLLGLAATFDNRSYHLHKKRDEAMVAERERNRFLKEKAQAESLNEPYVRMRNLLDAERIYEAAMQTFQELALDIAALYRTIDRVMALPEYADGPTTLAAQGDVMTVSKCLEETDSELLHLATVCTDVELFPDLDPGTAVFEFSQLLDRAFEREGQPMVLARLSEKEKLAAANAIMRELEQKANPNNSFLGRRLVVEIMDRDQSLEAVLGIDIKSVVQPIIAGAEQAVSLLLVKGDI